MKNLFYLVLILIPCIVAGQDSQQDRGKQEQLNSPKSVDKALETKKDESHRTSTAATDKKGRQVYDSGKEMELGEINIKAIIEKPNVAIIPKRVKPELEEVLFIDRSFDRELKQVPKNILLHDDELDRPKKVEGLDKVIDKAKRADSKDN